MSLKDKKKVKLNFIFGTLGQIITLLVGLCLPRLFIMSFGSEVNGFLNSVSQVFVYIALLEAGVGAASTQALYGSVGKGDKGKINSILAATNQFYKKTAYWYTTLMLALAIVFPLLVKSNLDYWLMFGIVLLVGGSSVISYYAHAKYKLFLSVDGKDYINSVVTTTQQIFLSLLKAVLILLGFNVLAVQSGQLIFNVLQALFYYLYIKKKYKWLDLKVNPDFEAISQKKFVLVHQISTLVFNNTDVLIITFVCDLNAASIYALYKMFISMISMIINNFSNSINFKLGQSYHNNREGFLKMHNFYETFHVTITFALCAIAYMFYMPFVKLYTAGMDINYELTYMPLLVVSVEILSYARLPVLNVISYAGHFKETQWHSVLETVINLTTSIILVFKLEIYGVLIGTIIALLYRNNDIILYTNHKLLNQSAWRSYKIWITNILFSMISVAIFNVIPFKLDSYIPLFASAIIVCVVVVPLQLLVNFLLNKETGKEALKILKIKK